MEKTYGIVVIAWLIITMAACKKDGDDSAVRDYQGFWELAETSSLMPTKIYEAGNGNIFRINMDGTYAYSKNDSVTEVGNYAVASDNSVEENVCLTGLKDKYKKRFDISNVSTQFPVFLPRNKIFFYVDDEKLYMISGCFASDGGSLRVYRRAKVYAL